MKRQRKRGFTLLELVIVIAVVAILAAVLIPTFVNLIRLAKRSADEQTVAAMNLALEAEELADQKKPDDRDTAFDILRNAGFNVPVYPSSSGYQYYWIKEDNRVVLVEMDGDAPKAIVYPEQFAGRDISGYEADTDWFCLWYESGGGETPPEGGGGTEPDPADEFANKPIWVYESGSFSIQGNKIEYNENKPSEGLEVNELTTDKITDGCCIRLNETDTNKGVIELGSVITSTKGFTLDLNGCTLKRTEPTASTSYSCTVISMTANETLNIIDSKSGGKIQGPQTETKPTSSSKGLIDMEAGTLNLYSGELSKGVASQGGAVYCNNNITFNMYGGSIKDNVASKGGAIYSYASLSFTLEGDGSITGNRSEEGGGGIYVEYKSTSTTITIKENGTITENCSAVSGGGIYASGSNATIKIEGGEISDNKCSGSSSQGGAVYVKSTTGKFTMTGGAVTENTAQSGGAFYFNGLKKIVISGGSVTDNGLESDEGDYKATTTGGAIYAYGGGWNSRTTITISNCNIQNNHTNGEQPESGTGLGKDIYLDLHIDLTITGSPESIFGEGAKKYNSLFMKTSTTQSLEPSVEGWPDPDPEPEPKPNYSDKPVWVFNAGSFSWLQEGTKDAQINYTNADDPDKGYDTLEEVFADSDLADGFCIQLRNINGNQGIFELTGAIESGKSFTLDLNGCTLRRDEASMAAATYSCTVIKMTGTNTTLNIIDCSDDKSGKITGPECSEDVIKTVKDSLLAASAPSTTTYKYGLIDMEKDGALNLYSGTLTGGMAVNGGAVYCDNGRNIPFKMYGGTITENVGRQGGGVYYGARVSYEDGANEPMRFFEIIDGNITKNEAYNGGAICLYVEGNSGNDIKFVLKGGTISENMAQNSGGGIYADMIPNSDNYIFITIGGGRITDNKASGASSSTVGGGAIYAKRSIVFTMTSGTVSNNVAKVGAAFLFCNVGYFNGNSKHDGCTFTISGGSITGNGDATTTSIIKAEGHASNEKLTLNISDCTIQNNTVAEGSGIIINLGDYTTLNVTGHQSVFGTENQADVVKTGSTSSKCEWN